MKFHQVVTEMFSPASKEAEGAATIAVQGSILVGSYVDGGDTVPGRHRSSVCALKGAHRKLKMALGHIRPFSEEENGKEEVKWSATSTKAAKRKFEETTSLSEIAFLPKEGVDVRSIDQESCRLSKGVRVHSAKPKGRRIFRTVRITQKCSLEFQYCRPHKRMRLSNTESGDDHDNGDDRDNGDEVVLGGSGSAEATPAPSSTSRTLRRSPRLRHVPRVDYTRFF